jgi:hypothetical protein
MAITFKQIFKIYHQEVLSFKNQTFHFYSQKHVQIQKVVV